MLFFAGAQFDKYSTFYETTFLGDTTFFKTEFTTPTTFNKTQFSYTKNTPLLKSKKYRVEIFH